MNFCQFFNRNMKKMVYKHCWTPTESINVPLGILILLGTALECITIRPILFLISKLSVLLKIKIPYTELAVSALTVVAAWLVVMIARDFFIQPISTSWIAYLTGFLFLNVVYAAEIFMFAYYISNKNYEQSMKFLSTGFTPYIIIGITFSYIYNKTSSSCPLKKE